MQAAVNDARAELWRQRIESRKASGQSIRGWCRANGIGEHSFYFWRVRLGLSPVKRTSASSVEPRRRASKGTAFARVVVDPSGREVEGAGQKPKGVVVDRFDPLIAGPIRLRLVSGRELMLPASVPVEWLAELVGAIERRHAIPEGRR